MQTAKVITKIEANPLLDKRNYENRILRVAAYCRVSTDSEDQIESYNAQLKYYTQAIAQNPKWRFVDIYADEGITGTQDKKRYNFMRMIRDCQKGKIDYILTKSVARFARNIVDSLSYIRKLKALGIGIFFEEQNLDSLKTDSELMIGMYSVMAQSESENISANVRWGIQQRMKSGTFKFRYNILGYTKGADGEPAVVPEEAEIIKEIFSLFNGGSSLDQIKVVLENKKAKTKTGKIEWSKSYIKNILTNERYVGDMLLQKTFTENCLTKKVKKNRGEMAKYLISDNHTPIVSRDTFKYAQMELARRSGKRKVSDKGLTQQGKYSGKFALTDILVCGECGSPYRRITLTRKDGKIKAWRCLSRLEHGNEYCKHSPTIREEVLQKTICSALNNAIRNIDSAYEIILANISYALTGDDDVLDTFAIENQIKTLNEEIDEAVKRRIATQGDKSKYDKVIMDINQKILALKESLEIARNAMASNKKTELEMKRLQEWLKDTDRSFSEYNDTMIRRLIECIRVMDNTLLITIKGGIVLAADLRQ